MNKFFLIGIFLLAGCSLAPDFAAPDVKVPEAYREAAQAEAGNWKQAEPLVEKDRGQWWKVFGDDTLNALEEKAQSANPSLQAAAARVEQSRAIAGANVPSFLPDIDIGGNAVRAKPSDASGAAFGAPPGTVFKPYTMYSAQGVASYEADLFGRVRDNYAAYKLDAAAQEAAYRSALLALQADVAQYYFSLRSLDSERALLRDTVKIREEAARIMQRRFETGEAGEQDFSRAQSDLAGVKAELIALDRRRAAFEHALAVLSGEMPSSFTLEEGTLESAPPAIPAGLPSALLERRPDIAAAQDAMAAANARIGVARTAFFPRLILTASGGFESTELSDLFDWSSRSWALGQLGGSALAMSVFDSGRNLSRLDAAWAAYDEAVANYRAQVLVAFKDVEDNLSEQRLLAEQSRQHDAAAAAAARTTDLSQKRYDEGEVDYFEVVIAQRDSLAAERAAVSVRGQRFTTAVTLIRALGGGWPENLSQPETPAQPAPDLDASWAPPSELLPALQ